MPDGTSTPPSEGLPLSVILRRNLRGLVHGFLGALQPPPPLDVAAWPEQHVNFPEGSPAPGPFRHETAPYLEEILFELSPDRPGEEIPVIKCAQSGGTVVADLWLSSCLSSMNAPAMVIHPTVSQAKAWVARKYMKLVEASPVLDPDKGGCVLPQHSRTEGGSKADEVKFTNGSSILIAGSNSAATLRQHTIRFGVKDDLDGWAEDAEGEGDPDKLADARFKTYRQRGLAKVLSVSTPLILRSSRIMAKYALSDQRRYYMGCTGCGAVTDWDFEDIVANDVAPFRAHLVCPQCGCCHYDADKTAMLRAGVWIPTAKVGGVEPPKSIPRDEIAFWRERDMGEFTGRPGFWITGVMNAFERLDTIMAHAAEAKDDPKAWQVFVNTVLGRCYEIETDTPDWEKLAARKSADFQRGRGAWGPLVFVLTVDVQRDGLYFLLKGWNANEESWFLDYGFLAGETAEPGAPVWQRLHKLVDAGAPLPGGASFPIDRVLVDTNYNTDAAKAFIKARRDARCLAINGRDGWSRALIELARETEVKASGKKKRFGGVKVWQIGTYPAKNACVARYRKTLNKPSEAEGYERGVCHFPADAEDYLFEQLTSEFVVQVETRDGRVVHKWKARGDNHLFDCDVYNLAGLDHMGARADKRGHWSPDNWQQRENEIRRTIEAFGGEADLFDRIAPPAAVPEKAAEPEKGASLPAGLAGLAAQNRG